MFSGPCPIQSTCPRRKPVAVPLDMLTRREWVRRFVIGSATTWSLGGARSRLLADISPGAQPINIISLKLGEYPGLQNDFDSMQLNLFGSTALNGIITITRAPGNVFHVVSGTCTHERNITQPFVAGDTNAIVCNEHESKYDIQGKVISGAEEDQDDLPYYNSELSGDTLRIEIPNLNLKVNSVTVHSTDGDNRRLALRFPTKQGARYRVLYTPDLLTEPVVRPFSTTAIGIANRTEVTQDNVPPNPRTLYVDSDQVRGFYFIELVVDEYEH